MFNPFKKKPFKIDDFAKLVITEAKKADIGESLEYDPKRFVLTFKVRQAKLRRSS